MACSVVDSTVVHEERWIRMRRITYRDPHGVLRTWDAVERTTRKGEVDAVEVICVLRGKGREPSIITISQFRPPLGLVCLELPAGLIDEGETPESAAIRELKEETGYVGKVVSVGAVVYTDPGITNANQRPVTVEVDEDLPENVNPVACCEDGEFIQVKLVPLKDLNNYLKAEEANGKGIDSRLASLAAGIEVAREFLL